jgi:tetrahydromethanopterin S-methyltransferase subunit G
VSNSESESRQTGAEDRLTETRALVPYDFQSDEIDLVDLGVRLWRRWKLMLIIFLLCTGLGLALAFILPRTYRYTAVVGLGSYTAANGKIVAVMTPDSAAAALNSGLIEMALLRYRREHSVDPLKVKIAANVPNKSNTIVLVGTGTKKLQDAFEAVEKNAVALLVQNTAAQVNVLRSNLKRQLTAAQINLARIDDPQQIKAKRAGRQQRLAGAQASQANLKEQLTVLKEKRNRLNQAAKLYQGQIKALNAYITQARKASLTAANQAGTPTQAMAMLLINNQLQQNLQRMNNIEQKLTVTLPQKVAAVEAAVAANRQRQTVQKSAVIQAAANLANFDTERQRKVQGQKAVISNLKIRLGNIQETRLIVSPARSIKHVGLGRAVVAILGAVVGVILALLAAALVNYVVAVRRRLAPENS